MEQPQKAIEDANKALEFNCNSVKAILAKGEALYKLGNFEKALVSFYRGKRIWADPTIRLGIERCSEQILNILENENALKDRAAVENVVEGRKESHPKVILPSRSNRKKGKQKLLQHSEVNQIQSKYLSQDVKFLNKFLEFEKSQKRRSKNMVRQLERSLFG